MIAIFLGMIIYHLIFNNIYSYSMNSLKYDNMESLLLAQVILALLCILVISFSKNILKIPFSFIPNNIIVVDKIFFGLLIVVYCIDIYSSFFHKLWEINYLDKILLSLILNISIGFSEELYFRGFVINLLSEKVFANTKSYKKIVIISAILFGVFHLNNPKNLVPELGQVL